MHEQGGSVAVGSRDRTVIAGQLGRVPRDLTGVAVRCPYGYPAVTETAPVLSDGSPNPTLLHTTCPALVTVISSAEAAGGVRALRTACEEDPDLRRLLQDMTDAYRRRRTALHRERRVCTGHGPRLEAGIGGPDDPETAACLHAYAGALLAIVSGWLVPTGRGAVENARKTWERFLLPVEESWCTDRRCARFDDARIRAAIDVGTISVRLLVADVTEDRPCALVREAEVTRLGEGLEPGGSLGEAARLRTAEVVAGFVKEARLHDVERILLAGTSAAREACDGSRFIRTLGSEHDLEAVVLSGRREAELAYVGACLDVPGDPVVLDVGGGSTELTIGLSAGQIQAVSLPLGASRATERWVKSDPPTSQELDGVMDEAARALENVRDTYGASKERSKADGEGTSGRQLVGVAGTVTTLAALAAGLEKYDSDVVHLWTLSQGEVRDLLAYLAGLTTVERAALPCVQAGRAPVIVAGTAITKAAMEVLGYEALTVSERDLLDGLVLEGP